MTPAYTGRMAPNQRLHLPVGGWCLAAAMLTGCMNMSGLNGKTNYGCKAPEGVKCDSVSGTYANAVQHNLPSQRAKGVGAGIEPGAATGVGAAALGDTRYAAARPAAAAAASAAAMSTPLTPLRSSARILRLWFKPWEDADHDLYDQGYVYVQIDNGQWLVEHAQRQIREAYAPLRPPPRSAAPAADGKAASGTGLHKALTPPQNPLQGLVPPVAKPSEAD